MKQMVKNNSTKHVLADDEVTCAHAKRLVKEQKMKYAIMTKTNVGNNAVAIYKNEPPRKWWDNVNGNWGEGRHSISMVISKAITSNNSPTAPCSYDLFLFEDETEADEFAKKTTKQMKRKGFTII